MLPCILDIEYNVVIKSDLKKKLVLEFIFG
jgi:hypothetical protein